MRVAVKSVEVHDIPTARCGFSLYKGVLILWDEDHDDRIFSWIDQYGSGCVSVHEHEATMTIVWNGRDDTRPTGYSVCGDFWTVEEHIEP